jgi:NAD(P)H dehydrogenase (quinone)
MKMLIIYAHPNTKSFNHAIFDAVQTGLREAGHDVRVRDLYALNLKTSLDVTDLALIQAGRIPEDVKLEQEHVAWAEALIFIHPIWWHDRPAILKGWLDRVMTHGFAYQYGATGPKGLLAGKKGLVLQTAGNPEAVYDGWGTKDALRAVALSAGLGFFGITDSDHKVFYGVGSVDDAARKAMLLQARELAIRLTHKPV